MEAVRSFGRLSSVAAARASVARRLSEAALKLGLGRHGCGHPVFMARSSLGRKVKARRGGHGLSAAAEQCRARHELEEGDDAADRQDRLVSETRRERGERG